jgi:hypothetical protein
MADDNDFSIGPGSDDEDDDASASEASARAARSAPPAIRRLDGGGTPAAAAPPAIVPAAESERPAITERTEAPPSPAPVAPAARPAAAPGPRLVSVDPSAPTPAPATDTTEPAGDLAQRLADLQNSIASLTAKVDGKATAAPAAAAPAAAAEVADDTEAPELDEEAVARDLERFREEDRYCVQWTKEFEENDARIKELGKKGGEYDLLSRNIAFIQGQLDPKAAGIEAEAPDDVTKEELERKLEPKLAKKERLRLEYNRLVSENVELNKRFDDRIARADQKIRERFAVRAQVSKADKDRSAQVTAGEREWHSAFKAEVLDRFSGLTYPEKHPKAGQPNEDALVLFNRLLDRAYARVSADPNTDFAKFIRENVGDEIVVLNARRGKATTAAAREKVADSRVPAPRGAAAVAENARPLSEITDPSERRRQAERLANQRSKLVLRVG